jgi:hypothetical protein
MESRKPTIQKSQLANSFKRQTKKATQTKSRPKTDNNFTNQLPQIIQESTEKLTKS